MSERLRAQIEQLTRYAKNGEVVHYRGDYGEFLLREEVLALLDAPVVERTPQGNRQIDLVCRSWNQIAYHINGENRQRTLTLSTPEDASKVWELIRNAHVQPATPVPSPAAAETAPEPAARAPHGEETQ